jgi:hypothetical protein
MQKSLAHCFAFLRKRVGDKAAPPAETDAVRHDKSSKKFHRAR